MLVGGQDKEEQGIGVKVADLECALDVDFKQDILALGEVGQNVGFGGAVIFTVDLGIFEEFIAVETFEEFFLGEELVFLSLVVARPLGTSGGGDGVDHVQFLGQLARNSGLADASGSAENDELAVFRGHRINDYSTFCTCSFSRSIEPLISTMCLAISASLALLAMVLASRSISWVIKSSLRPACSPVRQDCSNESRCVVKR